MKRSVQRRDLCGQPQKRDNPKKKSSCTVHCRNGLKNQILRLESKGSSNEGPSLAVNLVKMWKRILIRSGHPLRETNTGVRGLICSVVLHPKYRIVFQSSSWNAILPKAQEANPNRPIQFWLLMNLGTSTDTPPSPVAGGGGGGTATLRRAFAFRGEPKRRKSRRTSRRLNCLFIYTYIYIHIYILYIYT